MKAYISPSVQELNIGALNYGTEENKMNLIADTVVQLLQYNHIEVYRNKPTMTLQEVVADSNSKGVDIHFAIHSNAFNGTVRGSEIFYLSENGKNLSNCVYKYIEPLTPTADRGVKLHTGLYELNQTKAVASLIEVAFHDNPDDALFIMNNIQQLGEAIARGICDYFRIDFKKPQPIVPPKAVQTVGVDIKALQSLLNELGILNDIDNKPLDVDGDEGAKSKSAKAKAKAILQNILA